MFGVGADFAFAEDVNGFGGTTFPQDDYVGGKAFATYVHKTPGYTGADELQIALAATPLEYTTYGLLGYGYLCFYAAAPARPDQPIGTFTGYRGYSDGLSQIDGDADRLYGSTFVATLTGDNGIYQIEVDLKSVEDAFAEPLGQTSQSLGKATGSLTYANGQFSGVLTGPQGFSGTIGGQVQGRLNAGALLTFELSDASGDRIWGAVAADISGI